MDGMAGTEIQTVVVVVRGRVLDAVPFVVRDEAERYKAGVRRWAHEKGIKAEVWSMAMDGHRAARHTAGFALAKAS